MAEETKKSIPIEDGDKAEAKFEAEADVETETEAEVKSETKVEAGAEPEAGNTNENSEGEPGGAKAGEADGDAAENAEAAENEAGGEADEASEAAEKKDEPSPEEQESERYMRLMAEFQNFKRRAAREKSDIHAFANERIVSDLLPVLDNFERALESGADSTKTDGNGADSPDGQDGQEAAPVNEELANYAKGMELIFEQLRAALEKAGLREIEALGCDFDPNVHNAVMTEQTDEYEDGKVSKVMQKGYKLNDRVVRPAMVAVNKL